MTLLPIVLLVRIAVGTALGGIIGYEREISGRPAGLRTHILVALASATFMVISTHFVYLQGYLPGDLVEVDPSRIAASIVSGIGFLAGGAILRSGLTVRGLTTAAGLWLVAAIGMSAGAGMYEVAVFVTLLGLSVLTVARRFERKDGWVRRRLELVLDEGGSVSAISTQLHQTGVTVQMVEYEKHLATRITAATLEVRIPPSLTLQQLLGEIEGQPGVKRVRVEVK